MDERLAIVGDGLIGRSVRLAWERQHPGAAVASIDRGDDLSAPPAIDLGQPPAIDP